MMRTNKQLAKDLSRVKDKLAKLRDEMRDIEEECASLRMASEDAVESLEYAIEVISEQV